MKLNRLYNNTTVRPEIDMYYKDKEKLTLNIIEQLGVSKDKVTIENGKLTIDNIDSETITKFTNLMFKSLNSVKIGYEKLTLTL